jgi:hypothetical protein
MRTASVRPVSESTARMLAGALDALARPVSYRSFEPRESLFEKMERTRIPLFRPHSSRKRSLGVLLRELQLEWVTHKYSPFASARYVVNTMAIFNRVSPWSRPVEPGWGQVRLTGAYVLGSGWTEVTP